MGQPFSTKTSLLFYSFCLWFSSGTTLLRRKNILEQLDDYAVVSPRVEYFNDAKVAKGPGGFGQRRRNQSADVQGEPRGVKVSFRAFGEDFILHLSQNHELFSSSYVEKHYVDDDVGVSMTMALRHCFYHGVMEGHNDSLVAVSTCDGFEGLVDDGNTSFYIEPLRESQSTQWHAFYRLRDLRSNLPPSNESNAALAILGRRRLQGLSRQRIRRNVFEETKFVELVIVNDRSQFEANDGDISRSNFRAKQIVNLVDAMFKPLNVRVALTAVETWNVKNLINTDTDANKYLDSFQEYRINRLLSRHPNDNAQLLTRIPFTDSVRGKAHVMSICTRKSAGVVRDHSVNAAFTANTFAHELGHTFGMYHDGDWSNCTCNARACIMAAHVASEPATKFSTCSEESLRTTLARGMGSCLFNVPKKLFGGPVCGNGFVEEGEECDCGTGEQCMKAKDVCCDYSRCKLRQHVECRDGECCQDCKFKQRGIICREALNECDFSERCAGSSGFCPQNVHVRDGYTCANGTAYCYNGVCPTRDQQCRVLWGRGARSGPSLCYNYVNSQANNFGHCREINGTYIACKNEDVQCGKLLCLSTNKLPILGIHRRVKVFSWKISGKLISCKSANLDLGLDVTDPGVTLEGTRCSEGKICLNRKCVSLKLLKNRRPRCRKKCSNRGICNNMGKCHCFHPWTGLSCRVNASVLLSTTTTRSAQHSKSTVRPTTEKQHSTWWARSTGSGSTLDSRTPGYTEGRSTTNSVIIAAVSFASVVFLAVLGFVVHRCRRTSSHSYKTDRIGTGKFTSSRKDETAGGDMVAKAERSTVELPFITLKYCELDQTKCGAVERSYPSPESRCSVST